MIRVAQPNADDVAIQSVPTLEPSHRSASEPPREAPTAGEHPVVNASR